MKNHFLAEKRVCPLVLLRIITFHPAEPEIFCSFRIEIMLAWRFDWPGFLRALGNRPDQSPSMRTETVEHSTGVLKIPRLHSRSVRSDFQNARPVLSQT